MFKATLCILVFLIGYSGASAASITILSDEKQGQAALIKIEGDLDFGDDKTFSKFALQFDHAVVVLASNGGSLSAGLGIGKAIRLKQYYTYVESATTCASACALAWLGGTKRSMENGAKIGFHAAYLDQNGQLQESGIANALIGSYLNQLGLPEAAVEYITHAAPQSMQWLSHNDALEIGLSMSSQELKEPTPQKSVQSAPKKEASKKLVVGIDLFGFDLPNMPLKNSSWVLCNSACNDTANCRALTFNDASKTCFLKTGADLGVRYGPATSAYAEELETNIQLSSISILQRTDVVGNDFAKLENVDLEKCIRVCNEKQECRAFTYVPKKTQCWLKSQSERTIYKVGVVSGLK